MGSRLRTLARADLEQLLTALGEAGYELIGPTVRQGAIAFERIASVADLPIGLRDVQEGGTYRLEPRGDEAAFGFANGPQSWKRLLHPPVLSLWKARRSVDGAIEFAEQREEVPKRAFIGVRSCDLHAIATLDRSLLEIEHPDPHYAARREGIFIVAVNCSTAGGTCFCVSMDTGPRARSGFDLALTELLDDDHHRFLVEAGSEAGELLLAGLATRDASAEEVAAGELVTERTAAAMGRRMETEGLKELLDRNLEHPRWDEVSERCLTCGNCTMVCPTCFCTEVDDVSDLGGDEAERTRRWDSCFNLEFSHVHGGSVRSTSRSRYRQWMTHKLATWHDQFGTSGCVGCGRCITWCPVAIDITEEAAVIRATDGKTR